MQRRTKALLLIIFGLLVIIGVIVWLLWPSVQEQINKPQPPTYTEPIPTEPLPSEPVQLPQTTDPAVLESRRLEDRLRRFAQDFASRAGTYSNADGFAALREAGLEATAEVRTYFASERTRLTAEHGLRAGSWGQTTRGLASKITSPTPIRDQQVVTVEVDAQVITEAGTDNPVTSYRKALLTLRRTGDTWLVSKIEWLES